MYHALSLSTEDFYELRDEHLPSLSLTPRMMADLFYGIKVSTEKSETLIYLSVIRGYCHLIFRMGHCCNFT